MNGKVVVETTHKADKFIKCVWMLLVHEYLFSFLNLVICRSITRAAQNLVSPDLLQSQAVDVRMELDLRIGKFITSINFKIIWATCHVYL